MATQRKSIHEFATSIHQFTNSPIHQLSVAALLLATLVAFTPLAAAPASRIVAIADVHGAGDAFTGILQRAGLIDGQRRWAGGTAVFVQTGDLLDRGADAREVLDLLIALEPQAAKAGGRVQVLLGNHEFMNLLGETRDVAPDLFARFADDKSESRREQGFQAASTISRGKPLDKAAWLAAHPPGYLEYREAFKPNAPYGKWLRSKPIVTEIEGTIFMHGGINLDFTTESLDMINRRASREMVEWDQAFRWLAQHDLALPFSTLGEAIEAAASEYTRIAEKTKKNGVITEDDSNAAKILLPLINIGASSLLNPEGPMWFRGYSAWTDEEGVGKMAALLSKYRVKRFVTGHTPQPAGRITTRFGGGLFLIDTGMLDGKFYPNGRASALEIVGETVTPLYVEK
jgi:hypothetical protein